MYKVPRLVLLVALSLLAGCDDPAGPVGEPLTGTWTYSVPDITLGLQRCSITDLILTLEQNGSTFTGSTSGGISTCTTGQPEPVGDFPVSEGMIRGNRITFTIAGSQVRNDGTRSGDTVAGTATFGDAFGQNIVAAAFTMTRR